MKYSLLATTGEKQFNPQTGVISDKLDVKEEIPVNDGKTNRLITVVRDDFDESKGQLLSDALKAKGWFPAEWKASDKKHTLVAYSRKVVLLEI